MRAHRLRAVTDVHATLHDELPLEAIAEFALAKDEIAMRCPHCRQSLVRSSEPPFVLWTCRICGGCAATMAVLRKGVRHDAIQRAWARTMGAKRNARLPCPGCSMTMYRVPTEGPEIDLCRSCQMIWFDAGELEEMPHRSADEISAERKAESWARERREWRRKRDRDEAFLWWLGRRYPFWLG